MTRKSALLACLPLFITIWMTTWTTTSCVNAFVAPSSLSSRRNCGTTMIDGVSPIIVPSSCSSCYTSSSSSSRKRTIISSFSPRTTTPFSDIPNNQGNNNNNNDNNNNNSNNNNKQKKTGATPQQHDNDPFFSFQKPPPFPEDWITLSGDLFSLIVYGFVDHLIGCDLAQYIVRQADSIPKLMGLMDDYYNPTGGGGGIGGGAVVTLPVWLDVTNDVATRSILQAQVSRHYIVHYASPILQYTGSAVIFMVTFWVLAGWLTHAFEYRNTLYCRSDHALLRVATSWLVCIAMMLPTLALLSPEPLRNSDILFLVDSLTVLALWRFMVHWLIGSGESD